MIKRLIDRSILSCKINNQNNENEINNQNNENFTIWKLVNQLLLPIVKNGKLLPIVKNNDSIDCNDSNHDDNDNQFNKHYQHYWNNVIELIQSLNSKKDLSEYFYNKIQMKMQNGNKMEITNGNGNYSEIISFYLNLIDLLKCKNIRGALDYNFEIEFDKKENGHDNNERARRGILLSLLSSDEFIPARKMIMIEKGKDKFNSMNDTITELVGGDPDEIITMMASFSKLEESKSLVKGEKSKFHLYWMEAFAMYLWYSIENRNENENQNNRNTNDNKNDKNENDNFKCQIRKILEKIAHLYSPKNDIIFSLLCLYCGFSDYGKISLDPQVFGLENDWRLSWMTGIILINDERIISRKKNGNNGNSQDFLDSLISRVNSNFARQLEESGLWHFALSVYSDRGILERNVKIISLKEMEKMGLEMKGENEKEKMESREEKRENFLISNSIIPSSWISMTKATKAKELNLYRESFKWYIDAQEWNEAMKLSMEHLILEMIYRQDWKLLQDSWMPSFPLEYLNGKLEMMEMKTTRIVTGNDYQNINLGEIKEILVGLLISILLENWNLAQNILLMFKNIQKEIKESDKENLFREKRNEIDNYNYKKIEAAIVILSDKLGIKTGISNPCQSREGKIRLIKNILM